MAATTAANRKVFSFRIPSDLHREVKIRAIREDRPIEQLVEDALSSYLEREQDSSPPAPPAA